MLNEIQIQMIEDLQLNFGDLVKSRFLTFKLMNRGKTRWYSMANKSKKIEHYEKRFGLIAIEKGFITSDDLIKALTIQVHEDVAEGTHRQIGEILLDLGIMNANQIEAVVKIIFGSPGADMA